MAYNLGAIWLQVLPSFDGIQDAARRAGRDAAKDFNAGFDEGESAADKRRMERAQEKGKKLGDAEAQGKEKAQTAAAQREAARNERHRQQMEREAARHQNKVVELEQRHQDKISEVRERARAARDRQELASERRRVENLNKLRNKLISRARVDPDEVNKQMRRQINAALKDLDVDIDVDANTTEAQVKIAAIQNRLRALRDGSIDINVDAAGAMTELTAIIAAMQMLERDDVNIDVDVDTAGALASLLALEGATTAVGRSNRSLARSTSEASSGAGSAANAFRAMNGVLLAAVTIGPMVVPVLMAVAGALAAVATASLGAFAALGVGMLGLSGVGDAVSAMADLESEQQYGQTPAVQRRQNRQTRSAERGVRDARRGVADARRNAEDALTAALRRQENAQRSLTDAERNLSRTRVDVNERISDAIRAQEDATENLARTREVAAERIEDAIRREVEAQEAVIEAQERAQDLLVSSLDRQEDAERNLQRAQENARRAQEQLTRARRDARREIEDMNNALISGTLSEQDALYDLEEARYSLFRIQQDGSATQREKDRAQLAYDIQVQQFRELQLQNERLATDQAETAEKGVEGSDQVVDARRRIADADEQVADAERAIVDAAEARARAERDAVEMVEDARQAAADASRDRQRAEIDGARSIEAALERVSDAARNRQRAERDGARSIEDAERRLSDARRDVAEAGEAVARTREDNARSIQRAEERLADALQNQRDVALDAAEGVGALDTATRKLQEAMDNLSPAGKRFAAFLFGLRPLLDELRWTAQEGFLPGLQSGMEMVIETYFPRMLDFVDRFSRAMGAHAEDFGRWLTQPEVIEFFDLLADYAIIFMDQFAQIAPALAEGLMGIMRGLLPFAEVFGDWLITLSEGFAAWANSEAGQESIANFFEYLERINPVVWQLIAEIVQTIVLTLIGLAPHIDRLLGFFLGVFTWLSSLEPGTLAAGALAIMAIVTAFQLLAGTVSLLLTSMGLLANLKWLAGGFGTFMGMLGFGKAGAGAAAAGAGGAAVAGGGMRAAAMAIMRFGMIGLAIGAVLLGLWWLYENVQPVRDFVDSVVAAFVFMWNEGIYPIFQAVYDWVVTYLGPVFEWFREMFGRIWDWISLYLDVKWKILEIIFKLIWAGVEGLGMIFSWLWENVIKPVWNWIADFVSDKWNKYIKPVFSAIGDFIQKHVAPFFKKGVEQIGSIWEGLRALFAKPIVWVIDTVLNKGIIGTLNDVFDFFDIPKVGTVTVPPSIRSAARATSTRTGSAGGRAAATRRAQGGVLPGYTPGVDVHHFFSPTAGELYLSGGEGILRPEVVRAIGPATIDRWNNQAVMSGGASEPDDGRHFARGGILGWLGDLGGSALDWIKDIATYAWDFMSNPGKMLNAVVDRLTENAPEMGAMANRFVTGIPKGIVAKIAGGVGDMLGFGDPEGGPAWQDGGVGGYIRGAKPHVSWAANNIAKAVGGVNMMQAINQSMAGGHPKGLAVDYMDDRATMNAIAAYAASNANRLLVDYVAWQGRIFKPGRGWAPQRVGYGNDPWHRWHVHVEHENPGGAAGGILPDNVLLRDEGGWLPSDSMAINLSGRDEYTMSPDETEMLKGILKQDGRTGTYIDIDIDRPGATAGEIADEMLFTMRKLKRGGAYSGV